MAERQKDIEAHVQNLRWEARGSLKPFPLQEGIGLENIDQAIDQLLNRPLDTTYKLSMERYRSGLPTSTPEEDSARNTVIIWLDQIGDKYLTASEKERFNKYKHPGPEPDTNDSNFKRYKKRERERLQREWFENLMTYYFQQDEKHDTIFLRSQGWVRVAPKENVEN